MRRAATATRASPRIGVVGAGVGGLTLATILSRKLPHARLTVLERASSDRDEGYGLDLDEFGQLALINAGVYDSYWDVSRPRSDLMRMFPLRGDEPLINKWARYTEAESNRAGIRKLLLDAITSRGNAQVVHDCQVDGVRLTGTPGTAELVTACGEALGEFELVVDAGGLYSPLRSLRVEDAVGVHFTGRSLIHGVIDDPEAADPELARRIGEGTASAMGRGYGLTVQRFGCAPEDRRAAFFYFAPVRAADGELEAEMGLSKATSRASGTRQAAPDAANGGDLGKVQRWLHDDMGDRFDPAWHSAVDGLSSAVVRGIYSHGEESSLREEPNGEPRLPLVCCGDALRNIGLGGGGNLALQDALEMAEALSSKPGAFCDASGQLQPSALDALRKAEASALQRKKAHHRRVGGMWASLAQREPGVDPLCRSLGDFADRGHQKLALNAAGWLWARVHRFARWRKGREMGCDQKTPLHPKVAKAMAEDQLRSHAWGGVSAVLKEVNK